MQGKIVPVSAYNRLIKTALGSAAVGGLFFVDGFPKSVDALNKFEESVGVAYRSSLYFELTEDDARARLAEAGEEPDAITRKLGMFAVQVQPVIAALEQKGVLHRVDCSEGEPAMRRAAHAVIEKIVSEGTSAVGDVPIHKEPAAPYKPTGKVVLMLGGPATGKATACSSLASKYGCAHLSTGELLRAAVKDTSARGCMIADMIKGGKIIPAQVSLDLLKGAMAAAADGPYLVDGFPRSLDNLQLFEEQLGACATALYFSAEPETMAGRCEAAAKAKAEKGEAIDAEAIQRRIRTFRNQTLPVVEALESRGLVSTVDASASQEAVFEALCAVYDEKIA